MRKIICPRCRELGLGTDCAERLLVHDSDDYQLQVTVTFEIPAPAGPDLDPHEMAAHTRERFLSDLDVSSALQQAVADDDYQLNIRPVFYD